MSLQWNLNCLKTSSYFYKYIYVFNLEQGKRNYSEHIDGKKESTGTHLSTKAGI